MRFDGTRLVLSATDLSNFLSCRHRTALEMAEAYGKRKRPQIDDPLLELLHERGIVHEKAYVASLESAGRTSVDLSGEKDRATAMAMTMDAMSRGVEVIVQGALGDETWYGRPDVLTRVPVASELGAWSYEVADTKLSRETRAGTILQLGLYCELLAATQGKRPERFYVVTPDPAHPMQTYRVDDFAAYFRLVRQHMRSTVALDDDVIATTNYPEPVEHCDICPWTGDCRKKRRADDHLSLVANITRLHRREFEAQDVTTVAALAHLPVPLPFRPTRGASESYVRAREQARLQIQSRHLPVPLYEVRPIEKDRGLLRLPEPSPGDVFLDLEGDLFAREGGREYLFGVVTIGPDRVPTSRSFWGFTDAEERAAFEAVVDLIMEAWKDHDGMHVYHYAPYEPTAFKRLMGRYVTREEELDRLLRAERFVDLYAVVRQGLRVGVEQYSIKRLEPLYAYVREAKLEDANRSLKVMEYLLGLERPHEVPDEDRSTIEAYNRDDCRSTLWLRDWLESVREKEIARGTHIPRPVPDDGSPSDALDEKVQQVQALRAKLLDGVPKDVSARDDSQQARWLLAYLLDFHRREDKAAWWEYYRLRELAEEDLVDEPQAITGLEYVSRVFEKRHAKSGKLTGTVVDRYRWPQQDMEIGDGADLKLFQSGKNFGKVVDVDRLARTIDVQKGRAQLDQHPPSLFASTIVPSEAMAKSLFELGARVASDPAVLEREPGDIGAALDVLMARPPRLRSGPFSGDGASVPLAIATVDSLDASVLPIQGPPGSGKTYCGSQMICHLVRQGKRVGITATSHKVIRHLLARVGKEAARASVDVQLVHKGDDDDLDDSGITVMTGNDEVREALRSGAANVVGGTPWLWARADFASSVDVLFVDEAGQMSLANVLAVARSAKSLVLLGDRRQLDQPQRGSHPDGVDVSALDHLLRGHTTIPADRGLFLPETWRLAPAVCAFTSELFYEGKLRSREGLERQRLSGTDIFDGSGLAVVDTLHEGNHNFADEEVLVVSNLVDRLTAPGARWTDGDGVEHPMTSHDVLVVAPYNAQVSRLEERLGSQGVRVGTVDKFQGQEAPVVIYSMATSRPEDAPRGMEFLYSANRLNVATSRARCLAIVVASPWLYEPACRNPRQMRLANALCRFRELARVVDSLELVNPDAWRSQGDGA